MVINICSIYWGTPILGTYIVSYSFLDWFLDHWVLSLSAVTVFILKSVLSDINISTWIEIFNKYFYFYFFLSFSSLWNIFFHLLTFDLYVPLGLGWVSCRQHIYRSCFCIHSSCLCLLVGEFNLFSVKVVIDLHVPFVIFLIVLSLFL